MFVVAKSGGKQYKMEVGKIVEVDYLGREAGETVVLGNVLLCFDGENAISPASVKVECRVVANGKRDKVIAFKKQRRTSNFEKRRGYRATYTSLIVDKIIVE